MRFLNPNYWKLKIFVNIVRNMSDKKIAEFIKEYGDREFKEETIGFCECARTKLAGICFEIGKLIR